MVKKKAKQVEKSTKKTLTKSTKVVKENSDEVISFKEIPEGASDSELLEIHQYNIQLIHKVQDSLVGSTMIDAEDKIIQSVVARIILIDRKIMAIGSRINALVAKKNKEEKDKKDSIVL